MKNPLNQAMSTLDSFVRNSKLGFANWMLVLLTSVLLFVYSLPNLIALRNLLLLAIFVLALRHFLEAAKEKSRSIMFMIALIGSLQVWMLIIAISISERPWHSLMEWKGQWLTAVMAFVAGVGLARALMLSKLKNPRATVAMIIVIPIFAFLIVNGIFVTYSTFLAGVLVPEQWGIGGQKGIIGYLLILICPILIADLVSRQKKSSSLLPLPIWGISLVFVLIFFTLIAASSRNGLLVLLLCVILGAAVMIYEVYDLWPIKKIITLAFVALTFVAVAVMVSYKVDPRWENFVETIPLAWDIDRNLNWLVHDGSNLPLTPSGQSVNGSQYFRIAWAHEGWRMLMQHPWGVEIARDVFPRLVQEKYGQGGMSHTHNSWLDMGLQIGILGLLMWGWILGLNARYGWQAWRIDRNPLGLGLAGLVAIYAAHGMLDSIFREHMLQQFMLVAGLLFSAIVFDKKDTKSISG